MSNPFASGARLHLLDALGEVREELEHLSPESSAPEVARMAIPVPQADSPELTEARQHIDQIDRELMVLLARRTELAQRAARAKAREGWPVLDLARKESLLAARCEWATELGLEPQEVESLRRARRVEPPVPSRSGPQWCALFSSGR